MSFRIFVIRLYQCRGDRSRPYSVLLISQKSPGLESVSLRGRKTMLISSSGIKAFQKAFFSVAFLKDTPFIYGRVGE